MGQLTFQHGKQIALRLRIDLDELLQDYGYDINEMTTADQLDAYLDYYNWDDGFCIPYLIICHPNCELATAINAFWLSEAVDYFDDDFLKNEISLYEKYWKNFVIFITENILHNHYKAITLKFPSHWKLSNAKLLYRQKFGWEKQMAFQIFFMG